MPKPTDRVQLHKQESAAGGGDAADSDEFLVTLPLEPNEDAPEVQGVFFQPPAPSTVKDEEVFICRDSSGNLCFKDENNTEKSLTQLAAAAGGLLPLESLIYTDDLCIIIVGCDFVEAP